MSKVTRSWRPGAVSRASRRASRRFAPIVTAIALVVAALDSAAPVAAQQASMPRETIAALAEATGDEGRREALVVALRARGLNVEDRPFVDPQARRGVNLEVTVPGAATRALLVGAHYDRVANSRGVVDNAVSCAVLVELLAALSTRPLRQVNVVGVFFDLEEVGLQGSRAWFDDRRRTAGRLPDYAVNVDIFGYGDTFYATASEPAGPLATALSASVVTSGVGVRMVPPAQYPPSDHGTMIQAGVETVGVALIDGAEVDRVLALLTPGATKPPAPPRILTIIHTPADTEAAVDMSDVTRGRLALEAYIRSFDASLAATRESTRP